MEKADKLRLVLAFVFGIAAVVLSIYGDAVGVRMKFRKDRDIFNITSGKKVLLNETLA